MLESKKQSILYASSNDYLAISWQDTLGFNIPATVILGFDGDDHVKTLGDIKPTLWILDSQNQPLSKSILLWEQATKKYGQDMPPTILMYWSNNDTFSHMMKKSEAINTAMDLNKLYLCDLSFIDTTEVVSKVADALNFKAPAP